ncbi:hypothetical protein ACGC1H_005798 [Rhizoctonia solani]|uniref:H-type lectin domain-containing protein n=1 Tax=Rhizoctonia solani TaxID=456999 RepID=A0A8H3BGE6_9AGAM|nr:unnamed protein product [Rhizoctonia solani]
MANQSALFNTNDVRAWTQPQLENSKEFTTTFPAVNIPLGINYIDYDRTKNIRLKSYFDSVKYDDKGNTFTGICHLDAWGDSTMWASGCTWLAHYNDRAFQSGIASVKPTEEYTTVDVKFESEYASTPKVVCWLRAFDLDKDGDWRIDVSATDVTTKGCKLKFRVWGTTKAYLIEASWIAYPADRSDIDSGSFDTQEQRPWDKPQNENQKKVTFTKTFTRPPRVYYAISRIDESNKGGPRVKSTVSDVTTKGMTVHLDSWSDTVMYTTVGQWIAYQYL